MNAHIQQVVVFIDQANGLLFTAVVVDDLQAIELPNAMVDMCNVVTLLQVVQFLNGQGFFSPETLPQVKFIVAVKYLMIGVTKQL